MSRTRPDGSALAATPLLERYEMKYLIPPSLLGPISDYLGGFCQLDAFSERAEDGFYERGLTKD